MPSCTPKKFVRGAATRCDQLLAYTNHSSPNVCNPAPYKVNKRIPPGRDGAPSSRHPESRYVHSGRHNRRQVPRAENSDRETGGGEGLFGARTQRKVPVQRGDTGKTPEHFQRPSGDARSPRNDHVLRPGNQRPVSRDLHGGAAQVKPTRLHVE